MFGFSHFIKILIDSGFSHTCVLFSNHFEDVLLSGKFHTCVIFPKHVWFFPNMCDFCHTCMIFTKHVRFIPKRGTFKPNITYNWFLNYFMALDCPIKKVKNAHPPSKKSHFVRTFTFPNICLLQVLHRVSVSCQNDNTKKQQGNATVSQTDRYQMESPNQTKGTKKFKS